MHILHCKRGLFGCCFSEVLSLSTKSSFGNVSQFCFLQILAPANIPHTKRQDYSLGKEVRKSRLGLWKNIRSSREVSSTVNILSYLDLTFTIKLCTVFFKKWATLLLSIFAVRDNPIHTLYILRPEWMAHKKQIKEQMLIIYLNIAFLKRLTHRVASSVINPLFLSSAILTIRFSFYWMGKNTQ